MPASKRHRIEPDARRPKIRPARSAAGAVISQELGQDFRPIGLEPFPRILAVSIKNAIERWSRDHLTARAAGLARIDHREAPRIVAHQSTTKIPRS
jgi:hypothetical protein